MNLKIELHHALYCGVVERYILNILTFMLYACNNPHRRLYSLTEKEVDKSVDQWLQILMLCFHRSLWNLRKCNIPEGDATLTIQCGYMCSRVRLVHSKRLASDQPPLHLFHTQEKKCFCNNLSRIAGLKICMYNPHNDNKYLMFKI